MDRAAAPGHPAIAALCATSGEHQVFSVGQVSRSWITLESLPTMSLRTAVRYDPRVSPEDHFRSLRLSAACAQLNREQITELLTITANLFEERKRIKRLLDQLPETFGEVRALLNELSRTLH
jgi:hypothetical protein